MPTTTRPRTLNRGDFIARCREVLDEGLSCEDAITKMDPVRGIGLTEQFLTDAVETISSALAVAHDVRNAAMVQAHKDFVSRERYATEFDGVAAKTRAHIRTSYKDAPIRAEKLNVLQAEQERRRAMATDAAEAWQRIQIARIPLDRAASGYPQAFPDFTPWVPTP